MRTLATGVEEFGRPGAERIRIWWMVRGRRARETLRRGTTLERAVYERKKRQEKVDETGVAPTPRKLTVEALFDGLVADYELRHKPAPRLTFLREHLAGRELAQHRPQLPAPRLQGRAAGSRGSRIRAAGRSSSSPIRARRSP
jgi:hypothetical protein